MTAQLLDLSHRIETGMFTHPDPTRPAHSQLLGSGVLVLEHLTGLGALPGRGARLHAAPPAWRGVGTWPVRAYALVPDTTRRTVT